jgi:hypothetical protein
MANFLYPSIKTKMLTGQFNWTTDNIRAILIATGQYTPSVNHTSLLDVPASAKVATSDVLTGKTVDVNVVDADDYLYTYVSGPEVNAVLLVATGSNDATSWLICHLDETVVGLPFAPSAGPVQLTWNNGANKIFAL